MLFNFFKNNEPQCRAHNAQCDTSPERINRLRFMLQQSEIGREVDEFIDGYLRCVKFDPNLNSAGLYNGKFNVIVLNPWLSDEHLIEVIFHEARHARQNQLGINCFNGLGRDDAIFLKRVLEADAYSYGAYALWSHCQDIGDMGMFDRVFEANGYDALAGAMKGRGHETKAAARKALFGVFFTDLKDVMDAEGQDMSDIFEKFNLAAAPKFGRLNLAWLAYNLGQPMTMIADDQNYLTQHRRNLLEHDLCWTGLNNPVGVSAAASYIPQKKLVSLTQGGQAA